MDQPFLVAVYDLTRTSTDMPSKASEAQIYMARQVVAQHDELPGQGWAICPSIVTSTLA
jgi:hypothetical protein